MKNPLAISILAVLIALMLLVDVDIPVFCREAYLWQWLLR